MANDNKGGRPIEYTDETYHAWLEEMRPFLERGKSLYKAIELTGLLKQKDTIYNKYRLKDWFFEKIEAYQKALGEKVNDIFVSLIEDAHAKVKRGEKLDKDDRDTLKFFAEKSRSTQAFFVNRFETAPGRPVEEVLDNLEEKTEETVDDVNENLQANEQPKLPQEAISQNPQNLQQQPENVAQVQQPEQPQQQPPQEQIVEGQITPDIIDPNATTPA